jgi:hypothetical protein
MKKLLLIIIFGLPFFSSSQNPLVKVWDKKFGGTYQDMLHCFMQTRDGGYILAGSSDSEIGGDKTEQPRGNKIWNGSDSVYCEDYWIVKIDSLGNKQWDKVLGGTWSENLYCMDITKDGGFILGGRSFSGVGGDKTEPNFDTVNTIASDF